MTIEQILAALKQYKKVLFRIGDTHYPVILRNYGIGQLPVYFDFIESSYRLIKDDNLNNVFIFG